MRNALLLGSALLLAACDGATGPSYTVLSPADDSAVPDSLRARYGDDAALLALRHLIETGDPAAQEVRLPEDLVESLYAALIRVHNAEAIPARDTVVDVYRIHTLGGWTIREIGVAVDSAAEWLEPWRRGERLTGNPAVDELMEQYGLDLARFHDFGSTSWDIAVLRAREPLNTIALGRLFEPIAGVESAEPNGVLGDGNDIRATVLPDSWRLDYSVGFGDCPAGCVDRHHWVFHVFDDGRVVFAESSGPAPPPPGSPWPSANGSDP